MTVLVFTPLQTEHNVLLDIILDFPKHYSVNVGF